MISGIFLGINYLIVSTRNCQYVSSDGPADVPDDIVELMEQFGRPGVACRVIARPDKHTPILQRERIKFNLTK